MKCELHGEQKAKPSDGVDVHTRGPQEVEEEPVVQVAVDEEREDDAPRNHAHHLRKRRTESPQNGPSHNYNTTRKTSRKRQNCLIWGSTLTWPWAIWQHRRAARASEGPKV